MNDTTLFGKRVDVSCGTCFKYWVDICLIGLGADVSDTFLTIKDPWRFRSRPPQSEGAKRRKAGPSRQGCPTLVA